MVHRIDGLCHAGPSAIFSGTTCLGKIALGLGRRRRYATHGLGRFAFSWIAVVAFDTTYLREIRLKRARESS